MIDDLIDDRSFTRSELGVFLNCRYEMFEGFAIHATDAPDHSIDRMLLAGDLLDEPFVTLGIIDVGPPPIFGFGWFRTMLADLLADRTPR
jgi:hypothetical protein